MSYRLAPEAQADIEAIANYIGELNPQAAVKLLRRFVDQWELLATQPYSGAGREDVLPGIRHLVMGTYIAFYRVDDGHVLILRILHGKRDITADDLEA
ncbi:type II toxin-antitoxin system RelE/ParE family toxin [Mesorhizobium sp. CGMCC 1.15528]|uniref:Type II toxin-antitoxin system RelE/ParE family toxin n=1 Tax=Mesorhizobium zhangyense TaxID=1776730 RepID=A0A7C9V5L2_9HYPH|nr:type II toxin-antitoxin system RelE/ParE family toxin [Mesorhizobium zhangyense]NGN41004.1 type II toxin-antitoxin system RelE/ParE family toxin [Mesorhizobium zhangyense]